jgi:hypothetical protein
MKEPEIISSGAAHHVSVAPGSHVATSHVAALHETVVQQHAVVESQHIPDSDPSNLKAVSIGQPKPEEAPHEAPAETVNRGRFFTAEPTAPPPKPSRDAGDEHEPEMDFVARLAHLKMENEKMRAVLAELEHSFEAP